MACETCKVDAKRFGVNRNGTLRFRCPQCRKTFSEPRKSLLGNMTVPTEKALMILNLFIEAPLGHFPPAPIQKRATV
jgi:transposase-like protein